MDQTVYFNVRSAGYEFPEDLLGNRGVALKITSGGRAELKIRRTSIAERLYRVTGEGICRDSVLVGAPVPLKQPVLNAQVMGQDGGLAITYVIPVIDTSVEFAKARHKEIPIEL